jgi:four helix bundle protein
MSVRKYRDLEVWQYAMELVTCVYQCTQRFPREETYGLTNQVRRAAASIPSNIAEGQGRRTTREFLHHLSIARGSLAEVDTQIEIAERLGFLSKDQAEGIGQVITSVAKLTNALISALEKKLAQTSSPTE